MIKIKIGILVMMLLLTSTLSVVGNINNNVPPTISIETPNDNDWIGGPLNHVLNISGIVNDTDGTVVSVKLWLNNDSCEWLNATIDGENWYYSWDSAEVYDKDKYIIYAKAIDNNGEEGYDQVTISIDNTPPMVYFKQPEFGRVYIGGSYRPLLSVLTGDLTLVIGSIPVLVEAIDLDMDPRNPPDHGEDVIDNVILCYDNTDISMIRDYNNRCWAHTISGLSLSYHKIQARATDSLGNVGYSETINFFFFCLFTH